MSGRVLLAKTSAYHSPCGRLAYPGPRLNHEGSHPQDQRKAWGATGEERRAGESLGARRVRAVVQEEPASREGAALWGRSSGPKRSSGGGTQVGGGVASGFIPVTPWRGIRTDPNFLLFASFSKYILKMTPKSSPSHHPPCPSQLTVACLAVILPIPSAYPQVLTDSFISSPF